MLKQNDVVDVIVLKATLYALFSENVISHNSTQFKKYRTVDD